MTYNEVLSAAQSLSESEAIFGTSVEHGQTL